MKKSAFIFFSLFAFAFLIFSCSSTKTFNVEINEIGTYPHPLIEPLPIKVGVYYGNDFGKFETTQKLEFVGIDGAIIFTYIDNIKMGKANIALFDHILSTVFEKVTPVQFLSKESDHKKDIDLIVEPTVHSFTYPSPTKPPVPSNYGVITIHIIYEINFYLPEGEKISSWSIKGSSAVLPGIELKHETTAVVELTQMAMRRVAAKFMTDFCNQVEIKKLFYSQCNQ
jgi:hypothetical protein